MFNELVLKTRSYRGFTPRKVTHEELLEMIDCARLCASSMNGQPYKFKLITAEADVNYGLSICKFAGSLKELNLPFEGTAPTAFIVICFDATINNAYDFFKYDAGIYAQTIMLKATEMGLGGCILTSFNAPSLKEYFNLNESITPAILLAFGEPNETIHIVDVEDGGSVKYYRDENNVHYVPKRQTSQLIL